MHQKMKKKKKAKISLKQKLLFTNYLLITTPLTIILLIIIP